MSRVFIYFIGPKDGPIKIGKAKNVKARLSGIQTGHPEDLYVWGVMLANERVESALHNKFKHLSLRGEWFRRDKELIDFIEFHTLTDEASYYLSHSLSGEYEKMKKELNEEKNKHRQYRKSAVIEARENAARDLYTKAIKKMSKELSCIWASNLNVLRGIYEAIEIINEKHLESRGASLNQNMIWKDLRDAVRDFCGVDWRIAESLIHEKYPSGKKIVHKDLDDLAFEYLRKNAFQFLNQRLDDRKEGDCA